MHGIAATTFGAKRIDIFWTDPNFGMTQRTWDGTRWLGWYQLGGLSWPEAIPKIQFASVPAAVAFLDRPPLVVEPSSEAGNQAVAGGRLTRETSSAEGSPGGEIVHATARLPGGITTNAGLVQRIDIFGLGLDYAMYTKTLWGAGKDNPDPWMSLGGIFISAPAAIAWEHGRIDVFGLGLDHAMYQKTWNGKVWSADWIRLGGTFSSAQSLVSWGPHRLDVFARGIDFTLRHRSYDGSAWTSDWQNLGGTLASEPIAISWGPDRLDVFAIFRDGALWHRWWDGAIWNDWESLGGSSATEGTLIGSPYAAAWGRDRMDVFATRSDGRLFHVWWSGDAWSAPEVFNSSGGTTGPTVISSAPNTLDVFAGAGDIYHRRFDGTGWHPSADNALEALGGQIAHPCRYLFSVEYVRADNPRSLESDTDTASASIAVGNSPAKTVSQFLGDLGGTVPNEAQTNLLHFDPVIVELCEAAAFNYLVVNNGHADQKSLDDAMVKAVGSVTDDSIKSVATELGAGVGVITSVELAGSIVAPIIGSLLGALAGWLLDQLGGVVFQNCDGIVAAELIVILGRDLHVKTAHGPWAPPPTVHQGTDSNTWCGANSLYEVTWSISRAGG